MLPLSSSSDVMGMTVYLGRHSQSGSNPKEESRTLKRSVCHPRYDILTQDNDICLLELSAPVNFTDDIYPVCLAAANSTFHNGTVSWVTGWGLKDDSKADCAGGGGGGAVAAVTCGRVSNRAAS